MDAKGVRGEFGVQPGTQSTGRVSMIGLDLELFGQLAIGGFDDLAHGLNPAQRVRRLFQMDGIPGVLRHTAIRPRTVGRNLTTPAST